MLVLALRPGLYQIFLSLCYTICVDFSDDSDTSKPTKMRGLERDSSLSFLVFDVFGICYHRMNDVRLVIV